MSDKSARIIKLNDDQKKEETNSSKENINRNISEVYWEALKEIDELLEQSKQSNNPET